mgnify:CR=1 FL=1
MTQSYAQRNRSTPSVTRTPNVLWWYAQRTRLSSTINRRHELRVLAHLLKLPLTPTYFQAPEAVPTPSVSAPEPPTKILRYRDPRRARRRSFPRLKFCSTLAPLSSNQTSEFIPLPFKSFHVLGGKYKYNTSKSIVL